VYEESYHEVYASRRDAKIVTARIRLGALTKHVDQRNSTAKPTKQSPLKMLDIGCSIGATVEAGKRMGWQAVGVDVSEDAVNYCQSQGLDCQKIEGPELPFEDNTFDVVTNWHVIEHVTDVKATLTEWYRVVRPGGLMVLETPDSQCYKAKKLGPDYEKFWPKAHLYTFTRSNMCSLLEQSGFEILPSQTIEKLTALPPHLTAYGAAYRGWRKLNRAVGFCKSIEVCCRKPL
jgi:ubiquinone/menaquinone biosynthesis C-methylase UbiE